MHPLSRSAPAFRPISLTLDPAEVAIGLRHLPGLAFFDTSGNTSALDTDPISIIAARPIEIVKGSLHQDLQKLKDRLSHYQLESAPDCGFPLGAACGWIDYQGHFEFGLYENLLVYKHHSRQWFEVGTLAAELRSGVVTQAVLDTRWEPSSQPDEFLAAVQRAQEYIAQGDIYQVNLSQEFRTEIPVETDLTDLYLRLRRCSPAPMAAWLRSTNHEILSSSPETFLRMHGRSLETRPIKGTRPRFLDPEADSLSAYELKTSEKELAELVMITDLERNDLGKVCEFGSVSVADLCRHEPLEHVHHLVSTVTGQLRPEFDQVDALQALFPGGSITGAPKKRAMEIIGELEPVPRNLYTGAIGYLGFNGESQLSIAIRTMVREIRNKTSTVDSLSYHVGAGIVADSRPADEFQETLLKAEGILQSVRSHPSRHRPK